MRFEKFSVRLPYLYLAFFILLSLSTVIATNGLIADSAATVIGAMIIAPLMQPIGAMAFLALFGVPLAILMDVPAELDSKFRSARYLHSPPAFNLAESGIKSGGDDRRQYPRLRRAA